LLRLRRCCEFAAISWTRIILKYPPQDRRRDMDRPLYVFIGYNPQELADTPNYRPSFQRGDILARIRKKKFLGLDEIIVVRLADDLIDSVWPEEVERLF